MSGIGYVSILSRLQSEVSGLTLLDGPTGFANAAAAGVPSGWVVMLHERVSGDGPGQMVKVRFGIVLKIGLEPDVGTDTLTPLRNQVRDALIGWSPASYAENCLYVGGRLLEQNTSALYWRDHFETMYYLRSA